MLIYHTTNRPKQIKKSGLRNVRKKYLNRTNYKLRNKVDEDRELKTTEAIYFFREEQMEINKNQKPKNVIFSIDSEMLERKDLWVFSYDQYCLVKKAKGKEKLNSAIEDYWRSKLNIEEYEKLSKKQKDSYKAEFLYFQEYIPIDNLDQL